MYKFLNYGYKGTRCFGNPPRANAEENINVRIKNFLLHWINGMSNLSELPLKTYFHKIEDYDIRIVWTNKERDGEKEREMRTCNVFLSYL